MNTLACNHVHITKKQDIAQSREDVFTFIANIGLYLIYTIPNSVYGNNLCTETTHFLPFGQLFCCLLEVFVIDDQELRPALPPFWWNDYFAWCDLQPLLNPPSWIDKEITVGFSIELWIANGILTRFIFFG